MCEKSVRRRGQDWNRATVWRDDGNIEEDGDACVGSRPNMMLEYDTDDEQV